MAGADAADGGGESLRRAVVQACHALEKAGVNRGTSGNVSVRRRGGLLITPSGVPCDSLGPGDIVPLSMEGETEHPLRPSSEWRMHRDILAVRPEFDAVVHAHPVFATAFAMRNEPIPAVHYMIAAAGGPSIRCAPYATYGSQALSDNALAALEGRKACLLANHGIVAAEASLERAVWLAVEVETLARQYHHARMLGTPAILPDEEIARVVRKFEAYGPRR